MPIPLTNRDGELCFAVKVVPGVSRTRVAGLLGAALKVTVAAAPEGGAANAAVLELLATVLGVPRADVRLRRGATNPHKEIAVAGLSEAELAARLSAAVAAG